MLALKLQKQPNQGGSNPSRFAADLQRREDQHLLRTVSLPRGVDLSSNDYLGLSAHPKMLKAAHEAIDATGMVGAAGSRLLRGHHEAHQQLEAHAAKLFAAPKALYLSSGFQANYALITTLADRHDVLIYDEFVHASTRDGIAASRAKSQRVTHNDLNAFEDALKTASANRRSDGEIWILAESLYSMDGDIAPVDALYDLAQRYDAWLVVDEAHATGVYGDKGLGVAYKAGAENHYNRLITLHTCGKSIGAAGALICAQAEIIDYLINAARPFIYSTAPMPMQASCVQAGLDLMTSAEGDALREKLHGHIQTVRQDIPGAPSQIIPLMIGDDGKAMRLANALQKAGYDIRAIRPPTVPKGTARLRLSLSAALDQNDLIGFLKTYKTLTHE